MSHTISKNGTRQIHVPVNIVIDELTSGRTVQLPPVYGLENNHTGKRLTYILQPPGSCGKEVEFKDMQDLVLLRVPVERWGDVINLWKSFSKLRVDVRRCMDLMPDTHPKARSEIIQFSVAANKPNFKQGHQFTPKVRVEWRFGAK